MGARNNHHGLGGRLPHQLRAEAHGPGQVQDAREVAAEGARAHDAPVCRLGGREQYLNLTLHGVRLQTSHAYVTPRVTASASQDSGAGASADMPECRKRNESSPAPQKRKLILRLRLLVFPVTDTVPEYRVSELILNPPQRTRRSCFQFYQFHPQPHPSSLLVFDDHHAVRFGCRHAGAEEINDALHCLH